MFTHRIRRKLALSHMLAVATAAALALQVAPAHADGPVDGTVFNKWLLRSSDKAMSLGPWYPEWSAPVWQTAYQGHGNQKFKFRYFDDGYFSLVDDSWWGGCVDIEGDSKSEEARIVSRPCDNTTSQRWSYSRDPGNLDYAYLTNKWSGLTVTLETTSNADEVKFVQRKKSGASTQQFRFSAA
ncbi:RICIN domain-containing protein [Streptomyces sp. R11]|uniref:RICIN domain-containing protein n=1 Tax=Streptomyces sp. R11 TaxID=3238625 RepID=A0AB39NBN2_9ACTN